MLIMFTCSQQKTFYEIYSFFLKTCSLLKDFFFICVCRGWGGGCVHMSAGNHGGHRRAVSLGLEMETVVSCSVWVLGINPNFCKSSAFLTSTMKSRLQPRHSPFNLSL